MVRRLELWLCSNVAPADFVLQPTSANLTLPLVPPRSHVPAGHANDDADRKSWKEGSHKEQRKTSGSEWIDIDEDKPRRRRKVVRASVAGNETSKRQNRQDKRFISNDLGRFFPKLGQILESGEPKAQPRPRQSELRAHNRDSDVTARRKSPVRARESTLQRQQESLLNLNASLLSVITGLTTSTDRSSGSNSTVTQRTYRRRHEGVSKRSHRSYRRPASHMSSPTRSHVSYEYVDDQDDRSVASTSSLQHQSEVESSDAPGTPSSRSTYPSPTPHNSKTGSLQAYHKDSASPSVESRTESLVTGSEMSGHSDSTYGEPSLIDEQYDYREPELHAHEYEQYAMPAHPSAFSPEHFDQMHRSHSRSPTSSQAPPQALQHYYQNFTPPDSIGAAQNIVEQHEVSNNLPPAPEAPSLDQRTVAGYEKLALELASSTSPVKPLYRKFEFLNHRLLLHLQDELSEMEETLRRMDEVIAQMQPDSERSPSSRRGEAYYGADIHHHRTALLGRIFVKTEQYNKAMSSYSTMVRNCAPANPADVSLYQSWMAKETPVHEIEARFLAHAEDLVMPCTRLASQASLSPITLLCCLVMLMLPPALFIIIPTLLGRLAITLTMSVAMAIIRSTSSLLPMLSPRDTAAYVAAFVLLMSVVALCVPQHTA